ncbi:MAG: tRNA (guanine-N1)-methyltransferase [Ignavibacteria bacterium]|nr:tRNA (guanine-N1)-methyltransferase [Ignavibacteria bacterium]
MRIELIAAVPEIFDSVLKNGIFRIAQEKKLIEIHVHNLHEYSNNRFGHIDDTQYGGGAGMVITCEPVFACIEKLMSERNYDEIIYMTPDGKPLTQSESNRLSLLQNIIILAGHYKGIDQRIRDKLISLEISLGDYVLSGGELPAVVLTDSIIRLLPGVMTNAESALEDSFQSGLLEAPLYTKPAEFRGMKVPEVLLQGNHKEINKWREEQALIKTHERRPDIQT